MYDKVKENIRIIYYNKFISNCVWVISMPKKQPTDFITPPKGGKALKDDSVLTISYYRRFLSSANLGPYGASDDDDGDGVAELKPPAEAEYEQRLIRRQEEAQYARHVKEARDPADSLDQDHQEGMGHGLQSHPLLANLPLGTDAPMERINAVENDAARMQLKRDLENKLRAKYSSSPTPRAY